jgi:hypothetical protein
MKAKCPISDVRLQFVRYRLNPVDMATNILNPLKPEEKLIIYLDSSFVRTTSAHEKTAY